jgi:hypothetical protein
MPRLNGDDATAELRRRGINVSIVGLTGEVRRRPAARPAVL